jgi:hypothetical protein
MPVMPGLRLERQNTDVPHVGQKYAKNWWPASVGRTNSRVAPVIAMCSSA